MAGYTQEQLDEQLVLIKLFQSGDISEDVLDRKLWVMKSEQDVVNAKQQQVYDVRREVDSYLGGDYGRQAYAGVNSMCQSAGVKAIRSGGDYSEAFNEVWNRERDRIEGDIQAKRNELYQCETTYQITKLASLWGLEIAQEPVQENPDEACNDFPTWELSGGKFYNTRAGIPDGINRLVLIRDSETEHRIRAFTHDETNWQDFFSGIEWNRKDHVYSDGNRWDGRITREQFNAIYENGRI